MSAKAETPHPHVATIVTGHFREGPQYTNWRSRGTDDYLLIFTRGGSGRVGYARGEAVVREGDLTLLRPGALHDYGTARGASAWEILWAHFLPYPHWLPLFDAWPETAAGLTIARLGSGVNETVDRVGAALAAMQESALSGRAHADALALNALEQALLWCDTAIPRSDAPRIDPRVRRARAYLVTHLGGPVTLGDAAAEVQLSESRLAHLFRDVTGETPQQFLESARLNRAEQLLALTNRTVTAIARDVGYENPFYFSLRFKRRAGLSPRDWRRKKAGEAGPGHDT